MQMDHPLITIAALVLPLIALRDVGLGYYHLYARIEPDPRHRAARAIMQYVSVLVWFFVIYAIVKIATAVLLDSRSAIPPAIVSTLATLAINHYVLRKPTDWRGKPPYLARDRRYDAFLKILADRAAEVRDRASQRDKYLQRFYENDRTRLQVISAYLEEHPDQRMIALKPHQLAYHPSYNRLSYFLIYLLALVPVMVPLAFDILSPTVTADNANMTTVAALLGTLLYGPLFDADNAWTWFIMAAILVIGTAVMMEFNRLRPVAPGFASLMIFAILGFVIWRYIDAYIVQELNTPFVQATDYILQKLNTLEGAADSSVARFIVGLAGGTSEFQSLRAASAEVREMIVQFQRIAGGLFILPAVIFWGWLSFRAIWELQFSEAAEVTFHHQMRMPEV